MLLLAGTLLRLVRVPGLIPIDDQFSLFEEERARHRKHDLETAIDKIRGKYSYGSVRCGLVLLALRLDLDAKGASVK